ncbi:hypothetical protein MKW92_030234 [Papaver armeniacum]|nr:hypothetical protein MKW92_030234 [Papaver armeniacum]
MKMNVYAFILVVTLLLLGISVSSFGAVLGEKLPSKQTHSKVDEKLKLLNKLSLKTIQTEYGDVIDCVDIYKQTAFDHPSLKNHTLQMKPSFYPATMSKNGSSMQAMSQSWWKSGSCPIGTIPIRRILKQELLNATSLENYGRKNPNVVYSNRSTIRQETNKTHAFNFLDKNGTSNFLNGTSNNFTLIAGKHPSTAMLITEGYSYIGAKGDINVWNPYIEKTNEYSTAQIWLVSGSARGNGECRSWMDGKHTCIKYFPIGLKSGFHETLQVNPTLYGDTKTRFFIYWTADGSHTTGCFDLTCTGFVQTNHEVALGSPIEPVSSEFGPQYEIAIFIFMDVNTSNWWLLLNHKEVGYWPGELFVLLRGSAKVVQFGGEVYSETIGKEGVKHTSTAMGSGGDARDMYTGAAYIHHVRIIDYSLTEKYPEWVMEYMDEPYCYSAYNYVQYIKEPEFYFGGHGSHWNPYCQ